jgi:pSer/pThr/pTyr-binding forkhead associated (FHA) protein
MLSNVSERVMHSVRMVLAGGWLVLITSMFYDPFTAYLTAPTNTYSPFHLNAQAACFPFQDQCLQMHPYPLGARIFWGMVVPGSILILVVLGHETWRRICPLSFLSQIPRALGIQRRRRVIDADTQSVRSELVSISPDSWLGRNSIYCQFGLLFAGLNIRLLFANSDRFGLGIYLLATIVAAISIGYLYAGKTWCHYICPMGPVQTIYTGTSGLAGSQAHQIQQPITQSMCRTIDATGAERSACVSCQSPCLDIDAERAYWENINKPGQKFLFYGYVGLVLGFFLYFPLYTGNWNYLSGPVWNETNQFANLLRPGFYLFDRAISIPKILAVPLTLGGFTAISYTIGLRSEKFYQAYARSRSFKISADLIQHRGLVIATFLAFNFLFCLGVKPTLSWLPIPGQQIVSWLAIIAITLWAYQSWGRSSEQYTRESLASGLRRQLKKLGIDLASALEGRSIEELDADEVYILAKTLPGLNHDRRIGIYQGLVQESVSLGQVSSVASLAVFKQLRQKLEITDREHHAILTELGIDDPHLFNSTRLVTVENQMRVSAYRQFLEILLIELVESGTPLETAMKLKHRQISALKQEYQITPAEEAQVLVGMGQESSLLVLGLQALIGQLQTLDWRDRALAERANSIPSIQLLQSIVREKQQLVFGQLLGILEILGDSNESQSAVTTVANLYGYGLERVWENLAKTDNWHLRLSPEITDGLTPKIAPAPVPQCLLAMETIATLQELWQDVEPLTQAASLDALYQLQPDLARSLVQKSIQPHPDKLVQEVMQRVQGISIQSELVPTWTAEIEVDGKQGQVKLQQSQLRIGRADDNDVVLADSQVSRYHAVIRLKDRGLELQDLGSVNGVNIGQKVIHNQSVTIQSGDLLHFNTWKARTTVMVQLEMSPLVTKGNKDRLDTLQKLMWLFRCGFFTGMRLEPLLELASLGLVRSYAPGEIICERGQQVREITIVVSGFAYRLPQQFDEIATIAPASSGNLQFAKHKSIAVPDGKSLQHFDMLATIAPTDNKPLQRFDEIETIAPASSSNLQLGNHRSIRQSRGYANDLRRQTGTILPGQAIDGLQILTRSNREFTMIAGGDRQADTMSVLAITASDFDAILDREPLLAKHLLGLLSKRLHTMQQVVSSKSERLRQRV